MATKWMAPVRFSNKWRPCSQQRCRGRAGASIRISEIGRKSPQGGFVAPQKCAFWINVPTHFKRRFSHPANSNREMDCKHVGHLSNWMANICSRCALIKFSFALRVVSLKRHLILMKTIGLNEKFLPNVRVVCKDIRSRIWGAHSQTLPPHNFVCLMQHTNGAVFSLRNCCDQKM